jgi:Tol biopolymer transport system component
MRGLLALAAALAALVAVPAAHEASPSTSKIVYESYSDGDYEIYAIDPETKVVAKLTSNTFEDSSPTPSPDGTEVAFYSASGTAVVNADGTGRRRLSGCTGYNLSWSPDGSMIACEGENSGDIANVQADGTGAHKLAGVEGYAPSWSPDGGTIAYVGSDQGIYAVDPAGGLVRQLTSHDASDLDLLAWSPDSKTIAFVSQEPDQSYRNDLYVVTADGNDLRRLVTNVSDESPAWSPDGALIAFTAPTAKKSVSAVYTISPDGSGKALAAAGVHGETATQPSWSPDGSQLAYVRGRFGGYAVDGDVFVVSRDGIRRQVTTPFPSGGSFSSPAWTEGTVQNGAQPPKLRWLPLPKTHQVGSKPVLAAVFGSGRTAAAPRQAECAPFVVWKLGTRSRSIDPCRDADLLLDMAVAGDRLAWVTAAVSHTEFPQYLDVAEPGHKGVVIASAEADPETGAGEYIDTLRGDGSLLAFNFWQENLNGSVSKLTSWRVLPPGSRSAQKCPASRGEIAPGESARRCLRLRAGNGTRLLSISDGRIVGVKSGRLVRILGPDGRLIRSLRASSSVLGAQVQGSRLVVLTAMQLQVFTSKGKTVARYALAKGADLPSPQLLHGSGNFALYWRGAVHLVRLSDGRDHVLTAAGQAPPVDAQLGRRGLFYVYNQQQTSKPGRILFVSNAKLAGLVKAG